MGPCAANEQNSSADGTELTGSGNEAVKPFAAASIVSVELLAKIEDLLSRLPLFGMGR